MTGGHGASAEHWPEQAKYTYADAQRQPAWHVATHGSNDGRLGVSRRWKQSLPKMVVSFGPTQSRIGPTKTGPKFRAKMPTVHRTASLLSCVGQRPPLATARDRTRMNKEE